ncbi:MAG: hypothetical protein K8J31_30725 [Anaerolineae bacterium]|nr:hypothetical protein [Anaerolineae bacterium]
MKLWIGSMIMAFTLGQVILAQAPSTVTMPRATLRVGVAQAVSVQIDCQAAACSAFALTIQYDPAILRVETARVGPYLGDQVFVVENHIDAASGTVQLDAATLGESATTSETTLLYLDVFALKAGTSQLEIVELRVADEVGNRLEAEGIAGEIIVQAAQAEPPTPTPTLSATDFEATVQAEMNLLLTQVETTRRALIPPTPTPDVIGTASARLTQTAQALSTPSRTPTVRPTRTPTIRPTATRMPTDTPRPSATATRTPTWTPRPTATQRPSTTPQPRSTIVPGEVDVIFHDDFDENILSPSFNVIENNMRPLAQNGLLLLNAADARSDFIGRSHSVGDDEGVVVLFRLEQGVPLDEFLLFLFLPSQDWYFHNPNVINYFHGIHTVFGSLSTQLRAGTWYYVMHQISEGGRFTTFVWERDQSIFQPLLSVSVDLGEEWSGKRWSTRIHVPKGTASLDLYEQIRFPRDYFACTVSAASLVNRRDEPAVTGEVVGQLRGRYLPVAGQTKGADGFIWWQLADESWVRSDVVVTAGACDDVPVK